MSKIKGARLAGRRIDPKSPLGQQLAKLRMHYLLAAYAAEDARAAAREADDRPAQDLEALRRQSANVPLDHYDGGKDVVDHYIRRKVIRQRIQQAIDEAESTHGRRPTSMGIPAETLDEVREACKDMGVDFVEAR